MSARSDTFDSCLAELVTPRLSERGFGFDHSRTYRKIVDGGEAVEIVNFQLGQRSLEGKFTVNLGVLSRAEADAQDLALDRAYPYSCRYQNRIGRVLPARSERLRNLPYLGMFFGAHDKWWRFSEDRALTSRQLETVCDLIVAHAIPWLENFSP